MDLAEKFAHSRLTVLEGKLKKILLVTIEKGPESLSVNDRAELANIVEEVGVLRNWDNKRKAEEQ